MRKSGLSKDASSRWLVPWYLLGFSGTCAVAGPWCCVCSGAARPRWVQELRYPCHSPRRLSICAADGWVARRKCRPALNPFFSCHNQSFSNAWLLLVTYRATLVMYSATCPGFEMYETIDWQSPDRHRGAQLCRTPATSSAALWRRTGVVPGVQAVDQIRRAHEASQSRNMFAGPLLVFELVGPSPHTGLSIDAVEHAPRRRHAATLGRSVEQERTVELVDQMNNMQRLICVVAQGPHTCYILNV